MIQKKSLKEAIQNPEIISVVGGLLGNPFAILDAPSNQLLSLDNSIGSCLITNLQSYTDKPQNENGNFCVFNTFNTKNKAYRFVEIIMMSGSRYYNICNDSVWRGWELLPRG